MATTFVLTRPDVFPSGTVAAYVKPALGVPASGAPSGSAVSSPSVVGNSVTFTGLADNTQYIAYQGSPDRYVSFRTTPASSVVAETDPVAEADLATHAALTTAAHGGLIPSGLVDTKGDLLTATADNTPARLAAGSNGQMLTAQSGQATGLLWAAAPSGSVAADTIFDAKGDLPAGTGADTAAKLAAGTNGQFLTAQSGQTTGLQWASPTMTAAVLGSDVPNSTTSYADVTGLGLAILAGTYTFMARLAWMSAATTTGSRFSLNGPTLSVMQYHVLWCGATGTTIAYQSTNSYDHAGTASTGVSSTASPFYAELSGFITVSADGTLIPRFASEVGASAITVKAGSVFQLWRVS